MEAILNIPEIDRVIKLNNITYNQYMVVRERSDRDSRMVERYTTGEPITLITSNMPFELGDAIDKIVEKYCNH